LDYAVLALYLVGITAFGSRFRRSHATVKDYFLGSRQTSWIVISLSIVATETSTLTLIGVPALAYGTYAHAEQGGSLTYLPVLAGYMLVHLVPGGWTAIVADASRAGKLQIVSWSWDPRLPFTFWAGLIGGTFLTMASHGTDQLLVQRLLTCRNLRDSRLALVFSGVVVFAQFALFLWIGIILHAYYAVYPLPAMASTDEILPAFII